MLARVRVHRRTRSGIGLAVVIGLGAGSVLAAATGARRTETAYSRFRTASAAADVRVFRYLALEGFYADLTSTMSNACRGGQRRTHPQLRPE